MSINIKDAKKRFSEQEALKGLTLHLEPGHSYALLGGNGAGKSTLIKSIMGLIALDSGDITIGGKYAYLPEHPSLSESMTAWQLLSHACKMHNQDQKTAKHLLEEVKLKKEAWHLKLSTYSKGMKQRTAIAFVLAGNPDWLILDEPMSGLDAMGRSLVIEILKKRHQLGVGILMCSHLVVDIIKLCEEVHVVVQGELKESIKVEERTIEQADILEQRLKYWSEDAVLD